MKSWKVPDEWAAEVTCIAICPKEEYIGIGLRNNCIGLMKMSEIMSEKDEHMNDADLF